MASAFQYNAFQDPGFQTSPTADLRTISDTDILQLPVDVVLAGEVPIKDRYREFDVRSANRRQSVAVRTGGARRLGGTAPSFRIRTDKRGYD